MTTKLVIIGANGRMGQALIQCILANEVEHLRLLGAVEHESCPQLGNDAGLNAGTSEAKVLLTSDLEGVGSKADVMIDFSSAASTLETVQKAACWGNATVVGTTGLSQEARALIMEASADTPIVMAPNMSLGVNLLFFLAREAASKLKEKGFDVEIVERHHRLKKDAPSGTALRLGECVAEGFDWDFGETSIFGREGNTPTPRPKKEIGLHAIRAGDIVGDHTVLFAAHGETVELSHRATSRNSFAIGALRAAKWVQGKGPGLYDMGDVLGL